MKFIKYALLPASVFYTDISIAQENDKPIVGSVGSFGGIGLLEMRNARFGSDGDISIGGGYFDDGQNYYATWQATPWLETTLRFSDYNDAIQGVDKGIDLKLRLVEEGQYKPSIAIGLQDLLGDGLFSGEYIVASKKIHNFDVTLGFGFGNLAGRAKLYNVARVFGDGFKSRSFDDPGSEKLRFSDYFSGEKMGFYWGVEYKTPVDGLTTKVEYSTFDKSQIGIFQDYESKTAFNFGANYKIRNWLEVGGGLHHGNQVSLHITLHQNLHKPSKLNVAKGPAVDAIKLRELRNTAEHSNDYKDATDPDIIFERLEGFGYTVTGFNLSNDHITVNVIVDRSVEFDDLVILGALLEQYEKATVKVSGREVSGTRNDNLGVSAIKAFKASTVFARENETDNLTSESIENIKSSIANRMTDRELSPRAIMLNSDDIIIEKSVGPFNEIPKNIGRTVRILSNEAPNNVERFTIISKERGVKVSKISVLRKDFEKLADYNSSPEEILANAIIHEPDINNQKNIPLDSFPNFQYGILPDVITHFGSDKDDHFKGDLNLKIFGRVNISENLQFYAEGKQHIIGNIDQIPASTNPNVPHVRSDIGRYAADGTTSVGRLTLEYIENPVKAIYSRITVGHLEAMYSGVSAEMLYRPYNSSFAIGADVNVVKQRGFNQLFDMRDYETVTGHLSAYYVNKKYDLTTKVSVGRYLAQDWGTTIEIYRQFKNGIRIGAKATYTDMSENDFGRGSFDKGVYMTVPFDFFWFKQSREKAKFKFRRLGKNGGQKLDHKTDLFDMLSEGQSTRIQNNWHKVLE